jgi:hypothetical protein
VRLHDEESLEELVGIVFVTDVRHGRTGCRDVPGDLESEGGLAHALGTSDDRQVARDQALADVGVQHWQPERKRRCRPVAGAHGVVDHPEEVTDGDTVTVESNADVLLRHRNINPRNDARRRATKTATPTCRARNRHGVTFVTL